MNTPQDTQYLEEDEIDLHELWETILKGKKIIAFICVVVVSLTFMSALKTPNVYTSKTILIPTSEDRGSAAMAGINIDGGGSMSPDIAFNSLLNNYTFMQQFVVKNKILEHYNNPKEDENYVFALGFRGLYDLSKSSTNKKNINKNIDAEFFKIIKKSNQICLLAVMKSQD
ncbi:MAG: hypothetical protein SPLUMA1_SPLUMAMAG1_00122 [uncultured Sulfurimonas sp.]|nr:MAG: hypothetical protein SPLUMA1_SPLUMAMAG1_00122 [uncultured Sulfurimonas sp.]